jgi:hypothetical protein
VEIRRWFSGVEYSRFSGGNWFMELLLLLAAHPPASSFSLPYAAERENMKGKGKWAAVSLVHLEKLCYNALN